MNIRKTILMTGLAIGCMSMAAQGTSAPYSPGITQDAVSYWLPKTKLRVTVTTRRSSFKPGEFSRYAERYLRLSDVKDKAQEEWEITGITVSAYGTPDKDNLYTLSFPDKGNRPYFVLSNDGIIAAVNTHDVEEPLEPVPVATAAQEKEKVNPQDYMTEEILMAGSTSKMAELTAKEIYSIRESRNSITRGQADYIPADGESTVYILEYLTKQENALLTLFNGTRDVQEHVFTIDVNPDEPISKQILFRFSSKLGVLPVDNLAGEPVWIDITDKDMLKRQPEETSSKNSKRLGNKAKGPFLYYRIPGRAEIKIYNNRKSFLEEDVQIAQFGNVEVISSSVMGKHADTRITFDTNTGNIKYINK